MARKKRKRKGSMLDVIEVGALAPVTLSMGTGMASQVQAAAAAGHAVTPAHVTGAVTTGVVGVVGIKSIKAAMKHANKGMRKYKY